MPRLECADGFYYTAPVGSYATNGYGLHDTLGNAEELVADCWHPDYRGAPANGAAWLDARATCEHESRVARGGSWLSTAEGLTASARRGLHPAARTQMTGFRLAEDLHGQ